ncbi:MAG: sigma-70 family RNA polymerase sigma factor [Ruminococcaceae bacterium]|nr:sigma-70 family RNA polymerase sigma factor [Oscillospiraceae bacterium]
MITAEETREEYICRHIGLVHTCAHRFKGRGIEYDDLFQAGCVGLIKAADGFEPERGLQFSTYAVPLILGEMRRLFREGGTVKVSRALKELSLRAVRAREQLAVELGREPTVEAIANVLQVEPAEAAQALCAGLPPLSLTADDQENEGRSWDLPTPSHEGAVTDRLALSQIIDRLEERDRRLIQLRYMNGKTQQATADLLGMSQVQVSRRERVLLEWMRQELTG